jgi:hypothetical protein
LGDPAATQEIGLFTTPSINAIGRKDMRAFVAGCLLLVATTAGAMELAGVSINDKVMTDEGSELYLNGAGIRAKFFFDIYIAELFLPTPAKTVEEIVGPDVRKRMVMHFLYDKVGRDKLVEAWEEGFSNNNSAEKAAGLRPRIDQFNSYFRDVIKGENVMLDYIPGQGTTVTIAGELRGVVAGKDFNDALLLIWLGDKPVTKKLKEQLLAH